MRVFPSGSHFRVMLVGITLAGVVLLSYCYSITREELRYHRAVEKRNSMAEPRKAAFDLMLLLDEKAQAASRKERPDKLWSIVTDDPLVSKRIDEERRYRFEIVTGDPGNWLVVAREIGTQEVLILLKGRFIAVSGAVPHDYAGCLGKASVGQQLWP